MNLADEYCPSSKSGKHYFMNPPTYRTDFEPVQYGESAEDTLYKRVEYTISVCACGMSVKRRVRYENG